MVGNARKSPAPTLVHHMRQLVNEDEPALCYITKEDNDQSQGNTKSSAV